MGRARALAPAKSIRSRLEYNRIECKQGLLCSSSSASSTGVFHWYPNKLKGHHWMNATQLGTVFPVVTSITASLRPLVSIINDQWWMSLGSAQTFINPIMERKGFVRWCYSQQREMRAIQDTHNRCIKARFGTSESECTNEVWSQWQCCLSQYHLDHGSVGTRVRSGRTYARWNISITIPSCNTLH